MSGTRADGSGTWYAYQVKGSESEVENYIRVVTTCEEYPKKESQVVSEDGSATFFSNNLIHSNNNELFLSDKYGAFTRNPIRKSLAAISKSIDAAENSGTSTRILEKKENILIEQDMQQEAEAQAEMDAAMSTYREANKKADAPKAKSKARAKAVASEEQEDLA